LAETEASKFIDSDDEIVCYTEEKQETDEKSSVKTKIPHGAAELEIIKLSKDKKLMIEFWTFLRINLFVLLPFLSMMMMFF